MTLLVLETKGGAPSTWPIPLPASSSPQGKAGGGGERIDPKPAQELSSPSTWPWGSREQSGPWSKWHLVGLTSSCGSALEQGRETSPGPGPGLKVSCREGLARLDVQFLPSLGRWQMGSWDCCWPSLPARGGHKPSL